MLERDALETRVGAIELDYPLNARPSPGVERLILVADAEEGVVGCGEDPHEQFLHRFDVLVFIDEDALKAPLPTTAEPIVRAQRPHGEEDLVVELVVAGLRLIGLVELVERGDGPAQGIDWSTRAPLPRRAELTELDLRDGRASIGRIDHSPVSPTWSRARADRRRHWASVGLRGRSSPRSTPASLAIASPREWKVRASTLRTPACPSRA